MLHLVYRPGQFVLKRSVAFLVWPPECATAELERGCTSNLLVGARRTLVQDVEFAFDQLVELALRALSPSLNDAFTAIACIERLAAGLAEVARRPPQPSVLRDSEGAPRIVLKTTDFEGLSKRAFDQIRQNARSNLAVLLRMLEVISRLLEQIEQPERRRPLLTQARLIYQDARRCAITDEDADDVQQRFDTIAAYADGATLSRRAT